MEATYFLRVLSVALFNYTAYVNSFYHLIMLRLLTTRISVDLLNTLVQQIRTT